ASVLVSYTLKPPFGTVQFIEGRYAARAESIASRRSGYTPRKVSSWPRQSEVSRYSEITVWENDDGDRMAASLASTSFSRMACGASAHPTRSPGASVFEKVPR